ncbi:hypothetical protein SORBI_3010G271901 [Sorghum bicolor]|uniref:Exocyst subunit Exo70 family protein n=1 Tax=Sorghum bicolor TaxID=4558 RepID=A0A1W0VV62_SORBI|nr:hypothetical protein SORBI_3010G271901 [Sorghum bicolor]
MEAKGASASRTLSGDVSWKPNWRRELRSSPGGSSSTTISHPLDPQQEKKLDFVMRLFDDFCVANGDASSVLELWLPEMAAVSRRRHVVAGDPTSLLQFAGSWVGALTGIAESIRNAYLAAMFSVPEGGPVHMSPFVDAVVAPYSSCSITHGGGESEIIVVADGAPSPTAQPLIGVREAVSRASQDIRLSFCSTSSVEAKMITQMRWPASCYRKQASWIWSIIQEVRAHLLPSTELEVDDGPCLLSANCATVYRIVGQFAARFPGYVPTIDSMSPLNSLIMETVSGLDEKLAEKSRSFPDQSLRFLFLINNSYFIWQHLYPISVPEVNNFLEVKIDNYVQTYLQVSWEPSEFQKTYNAQKFWKVPDPKLRRRLRVAIIEEVVSSFTKYLEYNDIIPSRITPHDLMDMLQELFEG